MKPGDIIVHEERPTAYWRILSINKSLIADYYKRISIEIIESKEKGYYPIGYIIKNYEGDMRLWKLVTPSHRGHPLTKIFV